LEHLQNIVPRMQHGGYTYILGSLSLVLYVGVTSDLRARLYQHKAKTFRGFTAKYRVDRLLYFEAFDDIRDAIAREKRIKGWLRQKKLALIETANPAYLDLAAGWFAGEDLTVGRSLAGIR
jgi:putative endonuclease